MIPSELQRAFEETHYIVHHQIPFTLRIGQNSPELDALLEVHGQSCAAFITAWNPMCQQLSESKNHIRHQALLYELQQCGLRWISGVGCHPSNGWPGEESVLVLGVGLEDAQRISQQFKQMACVFYCRSGQAQLISCLCHP
jgi:Protein of unknown function (DUF3293)